MSEESRHETRRPGKRRLIYGCMRLTGDGGADDRARGMRAVHAALDAGFTAFDHADIYAGGECERLFGTVLKRSPGLRERLEIISKCGIRFRGDPHEQSPKRYDFSATHIVSSVEGSLGRLGTDRLDLLLLHRPDYLGAPDEIARAFDTLASSGKVRRFGISNFRPAAVGALQAALDVPLAAHQIEINLARLDALHDGTLDQCVERGIEPQAWSPLRGSVLPGQDPDADARVRAELAAQAERYGAAGWLIALAWLLRIPAAVAPVIGTTNGDRIGQASGALAIDYAREDWYRLLEARYGTELP